MAKAKSDPVGLTALSVGALGSSGLTERLIETMKLWVLGGALAPGERMPPERDLAALLKVSRSSVRQALKSLEVMGVLQARQGSGTYVTDAAEIILSQPSDLLMPLRDVSFAELFEARRAMEIETAASAASRATKQDLSELGDLLQRMQDHLDHPAAYHAADVSFHQKVAQVSGNKVFIWFNAMASKVMAEAWRQRAHQSDNTRNTLEEHRAIYSAIAQHDPEAARAATLAHLDLAKFYSPVTAKLEFRALGLS
jgi:DNA-binding FadR family transcriptional regulator